MKGLVIAAPQSASGKTTVTLGLLRALKRRGIGLAPGKAGPDYIDPAFHVAASGESCFNYDPWAMRSELIRANAALAAKGDRILVLEAMMGLFDAAADGKGSAADLAGELGLPVVLVIDCARMSHSVAALARGFSDFSPKVLVGGVILNRVASARHEAMLRDALERARIQVYGALPREERLVLPERHLGLVQASENGNLEAHIANAADLVERHVDITGLLHLSGRTVPVSVEANVPRLPPPGQKIAVARDLAFTFSYEHVLFGWRRRGAEISYFSPLADEAPAAGSDAVYLPGGYPELHAGRISASASFHAGVHRAIKGGARVYGECGGYMVLGEGLVDADGNRHRMLGALPLETSFAAPSRCLGYRRISPMPGFFWDMKMNAHEFHYATVLKEGAAERLFESVDALGNALGASGLKRGQVFGSFMHVIDRAD